jgi:hypothetical protein
MFIYFQKREETAADRAMGDQESSDEEQVSRVVLQEVYTHMNDNA